MRMAPKIRFMEGPWIFLNYAIYFTLDQWLLAYSTFGLTAAFLSCSPPNSKLLFNKLFMRNWSITHVPLSQSTQGPADLSLGTTALCSAVDMIKWLESLQPGMSTMKYRIDLKTNILIIHINYVTQKVFKIKSLDCFQGKTSANT